MSGAKGQRPLTPTERARLVEQAVRLHRRGYTIHSIAEAAGVNASTVSKSMNAMGKGVGMSKPQDPSLPPLHPLRWRDRDFLLDTPALYQRSTTIPLLRQIIETCKHDNAVVRFASDVHDAREASDQQWLATANYTLGEAMQYLSRLSMVLTNPEARERAIRDNTERDDIAPMLRIVPDEMS